mgnify:CR=1 FL=1|jgi:uncharacterized protein YeaC (DUF1315 family)
MTDKADSFQTMIESITPEIHENLKTAVETGRWPNGDKLSQKQVAHSLQAIIAYEASNLSAEQRVGYIDKSGLQGGQGPGHHHEEGGSCASEPAPITWIDPGKHSTH